MIPEKEGRVTGGRKQKGEAMQEHPSKLATAIGHWFIDSTEPPEKQCKLFLGIPLRQGRKKKAYFYWLPSLIG